MMKNDNFCAFILSHGRADNVRTYDTLRKHGYTGKIYLIVDDEDKSIDEYRNNFGDKVIVFSKDEASQYCDPMDNFHDRRTPLFARNYLWQIARRVGVKNFIELDDDYTEFIFKYDKDKVYISRIPITNLDAVFDCMVDFLNSTPTTCIAMAQGGDYIGGPNGMFGKKIFLRRKVMNTFVCDVDKPFYFRGIFNDDVNAYIFSGNIGMLMFSTNIICVQQPQTQQNAGGITETYKKYGTYVKSFYSVMLKPSFARISVIGNTDMRIHHSIKWKYAVPKLIDEKFKKK